MCKNHLSCRALPKYLRISDLLPEHYHVSVFGADFHTAQTFHGGSLSGHSNACADAKPKQKIRVLKIRYMFENCRDNRQTNSDIDRSSLTFIDSYSRLLLRNFWRQPPEYRKNISWRSGLISERTSVGLILTHTFRIVNKRKSGQPLTRYIV